MAGLAGGATWSYVTYLAVGLVAWRRRDSELLALATITVGLQTSVLLFNAVQAARYMAAPFVLGVLVLPLLVTRRPGAPAGGTGPDVTPTDPGPATGEGSPAGALGAGRAGAAVQARLDERG